MAKLLSYCDIEDDSKNQWNISGHSLHLRGKFQFTGEKKYALSNPIYNTSSALPTFIQALDFLIVDGYITPYQKTDLVNTFLGFTEDDDSGNDDYYEDDDDYDEDD